MVCIRHPPPEGKKSTAQSYEEIGLKTKRGHSLLAMGLLSVLSVGFAKADIVYTSTRTVGTATADLSITTDGTIGVLGASNILDWVIQMNDGATSFTLTRLNSQHLIAGNTLSATSNSLMFDFGAASGFALFQAPNIGAGRTFYCLQVSGCFDPTSTPGEAINPFNFYVYQSAERGGVAVIATTGSSSVPEPSEAALYVSGVALALGQLRRRGQRRRAVQTGAL
jgi:hypothetical protein